MAGVIQYLYCADDRLVRSVRRVEDVKKNLEGSGFTLPQGAVKFILSNTAVDAAIPGTHTILKVEPSNAISELPGSKEFIKLITPNAARGGYDLTRPDCTGPALVGIEAEAYFCGRDVSGSIPSRSPGRIIGFHPHRLFTRSKPVAKHEAETRNFLDRVNLER